MKAKIDLEKLFCYFVILTRFVDVFGGKNSFHIYRPSSRRRGDFVWGDALNVMSFHRNKMNEYLCKNYLANEIFQGFQNSSSEHSSNINKRNGRPQRSTSLARESLLSDTGSKKYQDWLDRSSTLEDIYNQFEHGEESLGHEDYEIADHELDHGDDLTEYALLDSKHLYPKPIETYEHYPSEHHHFHEHWEEKEKESDNEKGLKLKELFHFALTSIAFLAFATFMIEVIMSLMEVQPTVNSDYVLVPTTTGGTGPGSKKEAEAEENPRRKRSRRSPMDPISLETLNIISSKVLSSIEGLALLHEDDGECFQRALCQNSKYSKTLSGPQKIWLPLWNFGISWIGNRISSAKIASGDVSALKYLKAALTGLGNRECYVLHPKCDDRRRRKRNKNHSDTNTAT